MSSEPSKRLVVDEAQAGSRLDAYLASALGLGRAAAARLVGRVRLNGRRAPKGRTVQAGDEILLPGPQTVSSAMPHLLAHDPDVLVLSKPSGLPSVALVGSEAPAVASWIARTHPECASVGRPGEAGVVHRLDTGTSGVLLVARSALAYASLRDQFDRHAVEKTYIAVVAGHLDRPLEIDVAIGQHKKSRTRVRALEHPGRRYSVQQAETRVRPVRQIGAFTLVEATTSTGARHQIRVHLAHAGHPLVGDGTYGGPSVHGVDYALLHASQVAWTNPSSGQPEVAEDPLPEAWGPLLGLAHEELRRRGEPR